jgi:hypothetical protein
MQVGTDAEARLKVMLYEDIFKLMVAGLFGFKS